MASGSTQDISLLFGVDVGNDGSGSMKLIMDQLNSIVATINANPFKLKFEVDPASLNLIKSQIQEIHNLTGVKSFNSFNEMNDILGISASLDQIRDSSRQVAQVLSSMFVGVDGGASLFESHLERIRSLLDEINLKKIDVYASGGLTEMESNGLKNISVNIDSAVKGLVEFKQILTEILSVIQQINAKDFNVTNQFSVSKMDNQRKEVALYKNELIELFKVNEQLLGTLGTISNGSGFSTIKSALDATGNSNIYNLLTTLDRLKISIDSIKGIKSIAGLDTVKSQLMDLYNSLTAVFEKINTSGSMKVLLPDTSALQKASSDLAAFTSQQDKYNESVQRSVAQAVGANVPGITPNITGMSEQLSKITSETQTALNSIRAQIEKTFDLSTININSEALVAKLTNILTNISPLEQSLKQIGAQLSGALTINNAQFDTTKISESITKIKTEFETFKSDVVSDMQEIKIAIEEGFTGEGIKTYLGNLNTVVQSQKEVVSTAQAISSIVIANAEQAKSESQLAAETKKSAEAQERSAKASKKTSVIKQEAAVTEKRLFDAYRATHEILRKNAESINLDVYDKLIGKLSILNTVMDKVRYENMSVMQAFKSLKYSGKEFMESLNTDISELKLNIETMGKDGTISLSNLYTTMRKMNKVVYSGTETKNLNPEIYNTLSERFKLFNQVAEISKNELISVNEAFIKLGYSANEVMTSTNELLSKFNLEMSGVTSSDKVYSQLYSSINVLNSASKLDGTTEFNNLNSQITLIKEALKLVDQEGINVEEAFNRLGTTAKQTLESTKIASYALKISMSENKEEVTKTSEELMSLSKAYNALNKAQRLIVKNPTYKDTQEYKSLSESVATLTLAIEAAESGTMSLNAAFNLLGVDGKNLFESIDVSAAKLNNTLMSADSTSLTQAYNKLSQIEGLINSNSGKSIKGSDEYNNLATSMTLLSNAIKIAEENSISISQAFNQMGYNGKEAINNIDLSIVKFNRSISGIDVTSLTSAYSALLKYETLLSSNTNVKDNESYTKLSWDTNTLREAISLAEQQSISLGSAFNQMGVNCQETFDRMELSALRLKEAMVNTGVSGSISISDLNLKLSEMQKLLNKSDGNNSIDKSSQSFINLRNHIDLTRQALDLINNGGMSVEDALSSLGTNGSKYMSDVKVVTSEFKVTLTDAEQSARNLAASNKAAANSAKEAAKAEKERQTLLNKSYSLISRMQSASSKWTAAQNGKTSIAYSSITKNLSELRSLTSQYEHGAITAEVFKGKLKDFQNEFRASSEIIKQAGENTKSFSDRMGNVIQRFGAWFGVTRIIMYVIRSIREMISASIELNDAFTQLQIVTRNSESTFKNFGDTVAEVAKRTAVSMTDIVSSATTYARLGYDLETATKIAEYTAKLQNVGDIGVEDAQNAITAILKAYDDIDADHIEDVMNKLVVTGNNFPISVSQIAEGMNNASSALAAAGNTFEQSVALLTAANTTIQDASKSSTGLRTIAARIRKTDSELEALGESMTTAKYDELVRSLTGLNIALVDVNGEYRSTYDIMADIASKWESMSTMEQAALADVVAGTRQQSVFFSLIGQFQEASGAMDSMASSANTLDEAYATYLDSTTAHINQFKAASQSLAANIFDSKFLSTMVDIGRVMLEFNDALVKTKTIFLALPAAFGISKFIKLKIAMAADMAQANTLSASLIRQKTISDELSLSVSALTAKQYEKVQSDLLSALSSGKLTYAEYAQLSTAVELTAGNVALETSNFSLAASFQAVTAAIPGWGWFLIALTGVTVAIGAVIKANEEMRKEFSQNTEEFNNSIAPLEEYKKSIKEISESSDDMATKLSELGKIKDELSEKYDIQTGKIQNETQAVRELNDELDKEIRNKRQIYLNENEDSYKKATSQVNDFKENSFHPIRGNEIYGSFSFKTGNFQSDLKREKQGLNISDNILKLFDSTPDSAIGTFKLGTDAKNEIEYFKQLEEAYAKFGEIKRIKETNNSLTKDELELYGLVEKEYKALKEELYGEGGNVEETILEYAKAQAEELIAMYPKAGSSTEQWKKQLFALADGDEFVISSINDLVNAMEDLNDSTDPTNLELVTSSLQLLEGQLDSVKESISTADEYFEDLAKTIKDNNDIDKFFTSSEIIELLDKYPELNNAIDVTTYGYKIEAKALEELRAAKLEEQKTAIATQISETEETLKDTAEKLECYKAEIGGINDLAQAKIALADIEAKLSQLNELNTKKPITNPTLLGMKGMLEERRASLSGYIEMSNRIDELNQQLEKSKMQYTVLGSVFDDVTDKTKDTTSALNNKKNALKDLSDEYKDAQDAINDLIDLTMDMIKKQKELEKEALKEQLENYKKLIDKKKELIELEKDQYEFEKELKEQNRDLLEIQQELDALSVEGADYSLEDMKRKEELQDKLVEKQQDRTDFLYDHEVEVRKDALDKEKEAFEDNINTQIDAIEDYLKHEGWIRQQAIDLINGKSQQFYNDLYEYTMTYTKKSHYEFTKLWNDAYDALMKYGNGQIDVDMTLMYLMNRIAEIENEMNNLDNAINRAKSSASGLATSLDDIAIQYDKARVSAEEFKDAIDEAKEKASSASMSPIEAIKKLQGINTPTNLSNSSQRPQTLNDWLKSQGFVYHDGGVVQHQGITKNSEVLAKLMAGEVVVTPSQADNFFNNTLPKMVSSNTINNNSMSPTVSIGDINITGNADASVVSQIKSAQQEIVNSVFKVINGQKNIFNGGRIK